MKNQHIVTKSALAVAVATAFAAPAAFGAQSIIGAGASAVNTSVQYIILADYCKSATNTVFYDNGSAPSNTTAAPFSSPGGTVFRITCTPGSTATKFTGGLDISYDTTGGSWKGLTAQNPALLASAQQQTANLYPVSTVLTNGGTTLTGYVAKVNGATFTFTYVYGSTVSAVPSTTTVSFGLTDVEPSLFVNATVNQPLVNSTWDGTNGNIAAETPEYSSFSIGTGSTFTVGSLSATTPYPAFGAIFGIAASQKLYNALQADQIATSVLPSGCTTGSTAASCVPFISKAQYASLIASPNQVITGSLGYAPLFGSTAAQASYGAVEVARRDQGSGTQASSNAYFLGEGCVKGTEAINPPYLPNDIGINPGGGQGNEPVVFYSYNFTTTDVINRITNPVSSAVPSGGIVTATSPVPASIPGRTGTPTAQPGPASGYVIGVVAANKAPLSSGGFLRLDGFAPTTANAQFGLYNYVSTEHFYANPLASGDEKTLIVDLLGINGVPAAETLAGFSGAGYVQLSASGYTNNAQLCTGWQHL
jgi:hypothetical protein